LISMASTASSIQQNLHLPTPILTGGSHHRLTTRIPHAIATMALQTFRENDPFRALTRSLLSMPQYLLLLCFSSHFSCSVISFTCLNLIRSY